MFPTSPVEPRMAVSLELLEFYHALFQRSADAVTAVASALHTFYGQRGWDTLDSAVSKETMVLRAQQADCLS